MRGLNSVYFDVDPVPAASAVKGFFRRRPSDLLVTLLSHTGQACQHAADCA